MINEDKVLNLDLYKKFRSGDAPDTFHHVSFKTMNYDRMVDFYEKLFGCKPMYKSKEITFMTFDEEHHRIAIANTKPVFENLGFIPRLVMKFKNWINRAVPTLVGLDHISYRLNPIDQWFDFYFRAKKTRIRALLDNKSRLD
jgi:catechol 2,3-dioxygenase-like lactoylglutathione lyase family enzyme